MKYRTQEVSLRTGRRNGGKESVTATAGGSVGSVFRLFVKSEGRG